MSEYTIFRALSVAAALFLVGCEHPEDYRWSDKSKPIMPTATTPPPSSKFKWDGPSVNVYTYATPSPKGPTVLVKDLSDRAQAAFIEKATQKHVDTDKLSGLLAKPLGAKEITAEGAASVDESYDRTLVATVSEGLEAGPADRLVWTWIDIRPRNFLFTGYTVAQTDNETLNVESIQNQTTASLQAQYGITSSNTNGTTTTTAPATGSAGTTVADALSKVLGTSAGASASLSNQYTTSATINQQYEKLHVDITPNELRIFRGSERNLDSAGNTIVALTVRADPSKWHDPAKEVNVQRVRELTLLSKSGKMLSPDKVKVSLGLEKSPPHCSFRADVTLLYELRRVADARSYVEGEQKPEYIQKTVALKEPSEIVSADEVRPPSWEIYTSTGWPVQAVDPFLQDEPLDFSSYEQARDFAVWMNAQHGWSHLTNLRIGSGGYALSTGGKGTFPSGKFEAKLVENSRAGECLGTEESKAGAS